jgi:hypothetical protein
MFYGSRIWHRTLLRIALSGVQVFAWIFIFQYFYVRSHSIAEAVSSLALTFALTHVVVILLTPWSARRLRHGFKRLMVYALLSLAAAFTVLAASFAGYLGPIGWGVGFFAVLLGMYRALYWVPYEVAREATPTRRVAYSEYLVAIVPAAAGLFLTSTIYAPVALLAIGAAGVALSLIPLLGMADVHEGYAWRYRESFHELLSKSHRRLLLESMTSGIEMATLLLLWPLVIFLVLGWSYPMLGIVLSLTYIVALILRAVLRRPLKAATMPIRALLAASAWIMRLAVGGAVGVVLVDTYFYVGSRATSRGVDMSAHEHSADNNTYVDEYTALKEMGMALGRIIMCLLVAVLAVSFSLPIAFTIAFICAAFAAAAAVYLSQSGARKF